MEIREFAEPGDNDRAVQMALREIDTEQLLDIVAETPSELRTIIYRNVSKRVYDLLQRDVPEHERSPATGRKKRAMEVFLQLLRRFRNEVAEEMELRPQSGTAPDFDVSSVDAAVDAFRLLSAYTRAGGNLDDIARACDDRLASVGLALVADGWDALDVRALLEKRKQTLLTEESRRMDVIIEGIDAVASRQNPTVVRRRLQTMSGLSLTEQLEDR